MYYVLDAKEKKNHNHLFAKPLLFKGLTLIIPCYLSTNL
jgi:hypothetical protein